MTTATVPDRFDVVFAALSDPTRRSIVRRLADGEATVLELAENIWKRINGADVPFAYVSDNPFEHDVQKRVPSVQKAKDVLGFEGTTTLDETLDAVIPWIVQAVEDGLI